MKTLTYIGTVSPTGEIKLPKRLRAEVGKAFAGKDVIVTFARPKKTRSSEQNRYYWGVVVLMVCEGFQALGNPVNPDSVEDAELVHTYLKRRFLEPIRVADANGEVHDLGHTTTQLSTSQMMDYIAQVQQFALNFLTNTPPTQGSRYNYGRNKNNPCKMPHVRGSLPTPGKDQGGQREQMLRGEMLR